MFGNLLGNLEAQKQAMEAALSTIKVVGESEGGAVRITANGKKEVTDIKIDPQKLNLQDVEQLEDLILEAINRATKLAEEQAASEAQKMVKDLLPPGMDNLQGLFK